MARAADDAGAGAPGCERLGPAPAPLARLRGRHRVQLFVKGHAAPVRDAARAMLAAGDRLPEGVQAVIDLDPRSML